MFFLDNMHTKIFKSWHDRQAYINTIDWYEPFRLFEYETNPWQAYENLLFSN